MQWIGHQQQRFVHEGIYPNIKKTLGYFFNLTLLSECDIKRPITSVCSADRELYESSCKLNMSARVQSEKSVVFRETDWVCFHGRQRARARVQKRVTVRAAFQRNRAGLGVMKYYSPGITCMRHELWYFRFRDFCSCSGNEIDCQKIMSIMIECCVRWKCVCVFLFVCLLNLFVAGQLI